jgi:hypothetical protein
MKSILWMIVGAALWCAGILSEPKHKDLYFVEEGHVVIRTVMPSPTPVTLAFWAAAAIAGTMSVATALRKQSHVPQYH